MDPAKAASLRTIVDDTLAAVDEPMARRRSGAMMAPSPTRVTPDTRRHKGALGARMVVDRAARLQCIFVEGHGRATTGCHPDHDQLTTPAFTTATSPRPRPETHCGGLTPSAGELTSAGRAPCGNRQRCKAASHAHAPQGTRVDVACSNGPVTTRRVARLGLNERSPWGKLSSGDRVSFTFPWSGECTRSDRRRGS